jgi:hypothetical protein
VASTSAFQFSESIPSFWGDGVPAGVNHCGRLGYSVISIGSVVRTGISQGQHVPSSLVLSERTIKSLVTGDDKRVYVSEKGGVLTFAPSHPLSVSSL